jgi:hypothetical protein
VWKEPLLFTNDTPFELASVSKAFVATLSALLARAKGWQPAWIVMVDSSSNLPAHRSPVPKRAGLFAFPAVVLNVPVYAMENEIT